MKIAGQAYVQQSSQYPSHEAAYAAGAEAMRERAAKACGKIADKFTDNPVRTGAELCEAAIRALPLTESKP